MFELGIVKVGVEAAFLKEFFVSAFFYYVTVVHYENKVGVLYGGQAVGDDEGSFVLHQGFESLLYFYFGTGIYRRSGFVENEHRRVGEHYSRNTKELFLSLRYVAAVVAEDGIVAFFETGDKGMYMGFFRGFDYLFVGCVGFSVGDIFFYRAFFEPGVL